MKKLLYTLILLFAFTLAHGQTAEDKAKAYYQEAQKAFENKDYKQTIDYCKQVTDVLKTPSARIELLKIKSYYELGEYDKVKASIKTFINLEASTELKNEVLEYLVKVESVEKEAEEKRLAEQRRLEQERIAKEQKLAEEKRLEEEAEAKSYSNAMNGNIDAIRQFLKDYPNHQGKQSVLDLLDMKEEQAYNRAMTRNNVSECEEYLKIFDDGKYKTIVTNEMNKLKEREAYESAVRSNKVEGFEQYFNTYPSGNHRVAAVPLYEQVLNAEGQQAMLSKNYVKAKELYGKYKAQFPNGGHIKDAQVNYNHAMRKVKRQETIAGRKDKHYFMLNYATNESAGIEIGKLGISYSPSVYGTLNYGFRFPIKEDEVVELESIDDYAGDGRLRAGLISGTFGLNMKIVYPLWAYAGAGVKYQVYVDGSSTSYKITGENYWQFFPEFGLRARVGRKISLKAGVQLFKNKPAFQFGLGF